MATEILSGAGIYLIRCRANGKVYVGSTMDLSRRKRTHFSAMRRGKHQNPHLQSAVDKYGLSEVSFEVVERVDDVSTLLEREQCWIDVLHATNNRKGFNIRDRASSNAGIRHDLVTRAKISETLSAYLQRPEVSAKMSLVRTGTKRPEETREKLRAALKSARKALKESPDAITRMKETKERRRAENPLYGTSDRQRAAAARSGRANAGGANGMAKTTAEQVLQMREAHASGAAVKDIATLFGMSVKQTRDIVTLRAWKHIEAVSLGTL